MLKLSSAWAEYYRETEPSRRRELLGRLLREEPDDGAGRYRARVFELRHTDPADPSHEIDRLLWQCVNFIQVSASARFFKKKARKDVEACLLAIGYDELCGGGEAGKSAIYWEIRNGVRRYLKTCADSGYHRVLFGLMSSGQDSRSRQMGQDIRDMTVTLSSRLELAERLRLWNQAAIDEYSMLDPDGAAAVYAVLEQKG